MSLLYNSVLSLSTSIIVVELLDVANAEDTFNQSNYRKSNLVSESTWNVSNWGIVKKYYLGNSLFIQEL